MRRSSGGVGGGQGEEVGRKAELRQPGSGIIRFQVFRFSSPRSPFRGELFVRPAVSSAMCLRVVIMFRGFPI